MKKCPTCNAVYKGKPTCHRCRTDLSPLLALEKQVQNHIQLALEAHIQKDYARMLFHARRAFMIRKNTVTTRVYACAAMLCGHFWLAFSLGKHIVK